MKRLSESFRELVFFCEPISKKDQERIINDDLSREKEFIKQALQSCLLAKQSIASNSYTFARPDGFFGVMLKTSEQIAKSQEKYEESAKEIKRVEEVRRQRLLKKEAKTVQRDRIAEKQKTQKNAMKRPSNKELETFEKDVSSKRQIGHKKLPVKGGKRQYKDKKYGFGGKKRGVKRNDKSSTGDDSGFNPKKNKMNFK